MVLSAVFIPMAFFGGSTGVWLSSVLYHHRIGDGAVGAGRADPDARAVRDDAQTRRQRRSWRKGKTFSAGSPPVR